MHKFDYSFLDNGLLPTGILNLTSTISALKALANERRDKNLQGIEMCLTKFIPDTWNFQCVKKRFFICIRRCWILRIILMGDSTNRMTT